MQPTETPAGRATCSPASGSRTLPWLAATATLCDRVSVELRSRPPQIARPQHVTLGGFAWLAVIFSW